jgi:trehalose/maltose transport system substrate-binding protein
VEKLIVRPSSIAGARYNELSSSIFEEFFRALTGMKPPQQATEDMLTGIRTALRR